MCTCVHVGVFFSLLVSYFFFFSSLLFLSFVRFSGSSSVLGCIISSRKMCVRDIQVSLSQLQIPIFNVFFKGFLLLEESQFSYRLWFPVLFFFPKRPGHLDPVVVLL